MTINYHYFNTIDTVDSLKGYAIHIYCNECKKGYSIHSLLVNRTNKKNEVEKRLIKKEINQQIIIDDILKDCEKKLKKENFKKF